MSFSDFTRSVREKTKQFTKKTKELGGKALGFVGSNLAKTGMFLQDNNDYAKVMEEKRVVLVAFDEHSKIQEEVMLYLPIWQSKVFVDVASLRFLNKEKSDILIHEHSFTMPIEMRVYFQGIETAHFTDFDEIKGWWEDRKYSEEEFSKTNPKNIKKSNDKNVSDNLGNSDKKDPLKDPFNLK